MVNTCYMMLLFCDGRLLIYRKKTDKNFSRLEYRMAKESLMTQLSLQLRPQTQALSENTPLDL